MPGGGLQAVPERPAQGIPGRHQSRLTARPLSRVGGEVLQAHADLVSERSYRLAEGSVEAPAFVVGRQDADGGCCLGE